MPAQVRFTRLVRFSPLVLAGALAACGSTPMGGGSYPAGTVSSTAPAAPTLEYGRVTGIEYVPAGATSSRSPNVMGAVVGGVAGAVLGRQIGGGSGRDAATVLGGVGGAAIGSRVGQGQAQAAGSMSPSYRITVQTDQGVVRLYEVGAPGDLRVGDRVRVENGVIYRS